MTIHVDDEELGPGDTGEYLLGIVGAHQSAEDLRKRRSQALVGFAMNATWYAREDDLVGGWAVVPLDVAPSAGVYVIASFTEERVARHMAWLHNRWIRGRELERGGNLSELLGTSKEGHFGWVEDGEGGGWPRCKEDCGLEVVRPGKVQCDCDGQDLPASTGAA